MHRLDRAWCYPWATDGQIEAMEGRVFGHSYLVGNSIPGFGFSEFPSLQPLRWDPLRCEECELPRLFIDWSWREGKYVILDYNYRCCSACWSVIKKQLWDHLEAKITGRAANTVWGFLIEPATRSKRHGEYREWLSRLNWPEVFFMPLLPIPYSARHSEKEFWGWPF